MEVRCRGGTIEEKNSDTSSHTNKIHTHAHTYPCMVAGAFVAGTAFINYN